MARVTKPRQKHHRIRLVERGAFCPVKLVLVAGGRRNTYLWIGSMNGVERPCFTLSGPESLRALARAILREIPAKRL